MDKNREHFVVKFLVVGEYRAAVTVATERFCGEEAGASDLAEGGDAAPFVKRAHRLRAVFDDRHSELVGDLLYFIIIGGLPENIDCDNCFQVEFAFRLDFQDRFTEPGGIDIVGFGVNVRKNGRCAGQGDHFNSGEECERSRENGISLFEIQRHHRHKQCIGSAGASETVFSSCEVREFLFQFRDFRAENILSVHQDFLDCLVDVFFNAGILFLEIDKWNHAALTPL